MIGFIAKTRVIAAKREAEKKTGNVQIRAPQSRFCDLDPREHAFSSIILVSEQTFPLKDQPLRINKGSLHSTRLPIGN
jgi:hypothetical protein